MDNPRTDINFSAILKAGILLAVVAVVVHVLLWFVFDFLQERKAKLDPKPSPMFQKDQTPPEPQLQVNPPQDYQKLAASEDHILNSYGWVDPEKGIARIPISVAMKLIIEKEKASSSVRPEEPEE
jgi:hypothetical protein